MADSIRERIAQFFETAMTGIDGTGDFINVIASVQRFESDEQTFVENSNIIIISGDEEQQFGPDPLRTKEFTIELDLWLRHDKDIFAGSSDAFMNSWLADIERKLGEDHTAGGIAVDLAIVRVVPFETTSSDDGDWIGLLIQVEVHYRNSITDPTALV